MEHALNGLSLPEWRTAIAVTQQHMHKKFQLMLQKLQCSLSSFPSVSPEASFMKNQHMRQLFTLFLFCLTTLSSFASAPTVASSNFSFNAIDGGYFNLGWTAGNGARRLMVAKIGSQPTFVPQNGIDYDANTEFGLGQQVAPGEYIVYDHFSSSYFLTGLTPATHYYFRLYEYNGTGTTTEYLTASYLTGDGWTSATPTVQTSNAVFSNITTNSTNITWTMGDGQRRLILAKEGAPVSAEPVNNQPYNSATSVFGSGPDLGGGSYAVYWSSSDHTTITNLKAGTQYYFAFYEINGNQQPQYLKPAYTTSVTTRSVPTIAATDLVISKTDGKELTLTWTNGNGQRRLVVAKKGSEITSTPVDGTDYNANSVFGQGQQTGTGEFVVYDDNFHSTTVSGLEAGATYYFKVFEYDGTGSSTAYLTTSFAAVNGSTAVTPTVQTSMLPATNITATSLSLNFTPGNGRARLVVGRSGSAVNVNPVDFATYTESTSFGNGQDLGNGNFVLGTVTGQTLSIQNLQPGTTYHFAVYELNGYNQPLYLLPAATTSVTLKTLPVKLVRWDARFAGDRVELSWKTATELNTSHFVVERSADGVSFSPVLTVKAVGNSNVENSYVAVDDRPLIGKAYYRLKTVDQDGKWEYAAIRVVYSAGSDAVRLLTNPVQNKLQVISSAASSAEWQVVNAAGQVTGRGKLTEGQNEINVSALLPGQYWLQVDDAKQIRTIAFIKQ